MCTVSSLPQSYTSYWYYSEGNTEFSLFEALRDTIYSEVATLISQNENRPHFLIELFRELQMLNNDYMRQRALYTLHQLIGQQLTDSDVQAREPAAAAAAAAPEQRQVSS